MNSNSFNIQLSPDKTTVWVHADDGSTIGRFSKRFGMDVHTTVTQQLSGQAQCLHCTHSPPSQQEWLDFVALMRQHHGCTVPAHLIRIA